MSGGKIVSTLLDGNKIILDASMARILIESSRSGGDYSESQYQGSKITIDANNGLIEARSKSNSRVAYMSPTGIFVIMQKHKLFRLFWVIRIRLLS